MTLQRVARVGYTMVSQLVDPLRLARGMRAIGWYWSDYRTYRRMPGAERIALADLTPALHQRTAVHELDAHYFYLNAWAIRRILCQAPTRHVDIASQYVFASLLSAVLPVIFLDYRPLRVSVDGMISVGGDLLMLPFASGTLGSVSCLHVAEHIGLGRYGDPLDPDGTRRAAGELARVLAPGGNLYFAVPIGRPRVCFNAHRVHAGGAVLELFRELDLVEFAAVDDAGQFIENGSPAAFDRQEYACGMFWFRKPAYLK